ncbi:MAG: phosphatase [Bacteroidota bacterium]|nr:phosphatase [Bacteroidota bacterium]
MKIAVMDLGTNTFHLLIAEVKGDRAWQKILNTRITVKLGQGGLNKISKGAYDRGIKALEIFFHSLKEHDVSKVRAFGTAALRSASNGPGFLEEVKQKFGFNIGLISGQEEAALIYYGVRQAVKMGDEKSLIMDIGGGSVEFIIANRNTIFWKQSFKLGAALLLGKFLPKDPLSQQNISSIKTYFDSELEPLLEACRIYQPLWLIGSAGSFETFASMIRHRFPESGSHYGKTTHPIQLLHFEKLYQELILSTTAQRNEMRGLVKMRVDMIVMAALLLNFVIEKTAIQILKLSSYALKEGALWNILNETEEQI